MESQQSNFDLELDDVSTASLKEASKWTKVIAIIGLVGLVLMLLVATFSSAFMSTVFTNYMGDIGSSLGAFTGIFLGIVFVIAIIAGVFLYLLLSFANKTQNGLVSGNPVLLEQGTGALKNYFLLMGILSILGILFTIIGLFKGL